ncbi:MAG: hypothetical protein NE327_06290 [Lentisphaeraceae bacterium]|nr:hypothetical protein [Lentisphaeraceae bacterium]
MDTILLEKIIDLLEHMEEHNEWDFSNFVKPDLGDALDFLAELRNEVWKEINKRK